MRRWVQTRAGGWGERSARCGRHGGCAALLPRKSAFQVCLESGRATLGPGSYGEPEVYVFPEDSSTQLRIGAYCSIAAGTHESC